MALETMGYIKDFNIANPPGTDPKNQGDDHLRGIKKAVLGSFPAFVGTTAIPKSVALSEDQINDAALQGRDNTFVAANEFTLVPTVGGTDVALIDDIPAPPDLTVYSAKRPAYVATAGRIVTQADEDKVINFASGQMTLAPLAVGTQMVFMTEGAPAQLSITVGSATLHWLDGSGTVKTGSRTIQRNSFVALYWRTTTSIVIVGSGLS